MTISSTKDMIANKFPV